MICCFFSRKNVVTALTNYVKSMQGSQMPQFDITLSETDERVFRCRCTIIGVSCEGKSTELEIGYIEALSSKLWSISAEAPSTYVAKQRAAFLVLHQIEMNELKNSSSSSMVKKYALRLQPSVPERKQKWITLDSTADTSYPQFESDGYAVVAINFVDMYETQKMVLSIDEFVSKVAGKFNCTPEEYLSTTNYWRLPCKLTENIDGLIIHEILYDLERCFGIKDIKPTTSFLINMKNVAIDEGWADISKTPYEFRVWTPCFLDDYTKVELSDRFEIAASCDDTGAISNLYSPKIGESLVLRHNTKFKLVGPTQRDHFYFVSEWRRNGIIPTNRCESVNCDLFADPKKYEKIRCTLLLGLEKMRRLYLQFDLIECVDQWLFILDIYDGESVLRPHLLIDAYINVPVARQSLRLFRIFLKAKEHHGRNLAERIFLKAIDINLMKPITTYSNRNIAQNILPFGARLNQPYYRQQL